MHTAGVATNALRVVSRVVCSRRETEATGRTHKLPLMTVMMLRGGFRLQNMLIDGHDLRCWALLT